MLNMFKISLLGLCLVSFSAWALQSQDVPLSLQTWSDWVAADIADCPVRYNQADNKPAKICYWPSSLVLDIKPKQAKFNQKWKVYKNGWLDLPGDAKHWPQNVKINGKDAIVADRNGIPSLFVSKGKLNIQGQFDWQRNPEYLPIPINTGLITLTINNAPITIPQFDAKGRLWLSQNGANSSKISEENRLDIKVYRHIIDDIPLKINTQIELEVSGRHREVILGSVMLEQHQAMLLKSPLPTRLEADGHLRIQVRPGSWVLNLQTRQLGAVDHITLNPTKAKWVDTEIWTFEPKRDLRLVEITGVTAIDPQQTSLPAEWRKFPAYQVQSGDTLQFTEKRRGNPDPVPDQLNLERHFWLDFDGKGYSVQDRISGTMTRGWRLEMSEPAVLGRVAVNGKDQFITRLEKDGNTGVEVRRGQIDLVADSRLENELNQLPAVGWSHDFQRVSAVLHLPPGWRLWNATGVDYIPKTWLKHWTLLDLFIVLIMAVAVSKLWNWRWGVLTLITMILIYHETKAPHWVWLHIIASLALLKVLPSLGIFTRLIRLYRDFSLIGLLIIVLPFMMQQVRQSIYPQLEQPQQNLEHNYPPPQVMHMYSKNVADSVREEIQMASEEPMLEGKVSKDYGYSPKKSRMLQIDPNAQVQTGPGLPQWHWKDINMRWSGPVQQNQSVQLWLLSPTINSVLGVMRVVLLTILTIFFLWIAWGAKTRFKFNLKAFANVVILIAGLFILLPLTSQADEITGMLTGTEENLDEDDDDEEMSELFDNSNFIVNDLSSLNKSKGLVIHSFPPQSLLDELRERLAEPPKCLPYCASLPRLSIELQPAQLNIRMELHSLINTAVPLPGIAKQWLPEQVWINSKPAQGLLRDDKGQLWLDVKKGIHQVQIAGTLPKRNTIQLSLPLKPRSVNVTTNNGWKIEGLHENGIADKQLQFTREQDDSLAELEMGELSPFIQIERTLSLGLDWQILTRVIRQTALGSAIVLEIPLLEGESVTSEKIRVANGKALLNLSPNQQEISWNSIFDKENDITLIAADNIFSSEVWRLDASAIWHVEIEGIPVIQHQHEGQWLPEWRPWPNEKVTLHLTRPAGVEGQVLTIDRSELVINPGQRTTDSILSLNLRSSRGMQHKLLLPADANLQLVKINDVVQLVRQDGNTVTLPINPGTQAVELQFQQPTGMVDHFKTPQVDLGIDSVNTNIEVNMPRERWILFTGGGLVGPAVMVWGFLIVIVLAAIGLGQVSLTPLNTLHWLLLGVVLSQVNVVALLTVVGWFMALGLRQQMSKENASILKFNFTQVGLVLLTLVVVGIMLAAIEKGLLGHPDMHIAGNGSDAYSLQWYEDRTNGILPQVWVFSLSMWVYRIAMLLWALWLSFALVRWFRWGWDCFSSNGLWKESINKKTKFRESAPVKSGQS